jgi:hypothetical protein
MKYNLTFIMAISLFVLLMAGCATSTTSESSVTGTKESASAAEAQMAAFEKSYAEVDALRKKADGVGGEWRDVGKFMKEAQASAKAGDFDKAGSLLDTARFQSKAGYEQALAQKGAGPQY